MSKTHLSQNPMVVLKKSTLSAGAMPLTGPEGLVPRNALAEKLQKEYLKTAMLVSTPPWFLERAASYLTKWVEDNVQEVQKAAPRFVLEKVSITCGESVLTECERFQEFAPDPPKPIKAKPGPPAVAGPAQPMRVGPRAKAACKAKPQVKAKAKGKAKATMKRPGCDFRLGALT